MTNPRTIDGGSPDLADAINEARNARHHAAHAMELRQAADFYLGSRHGLTPDGARSRADECRSEAARHIVREHDALARLNGILLHAGGRPGETFAVGRSVYRCCTPGHLAAYLGEQPPGLDEIVAAFEPMDCPDDRDDDMAIYQGMVHIPH